MKTARQTSSLRRSLVMPAIAIMLVLSLGLVSVGYWAEKRIVGTMSEQLIRHMSNSIREHVTIIMDAPPRLLKRVQNAVARHRISLTDPHALAKELYALADDEPGVDWLYFANRGGGIISVGRLENGERVFLMSDNFRAGIIREYEATGDGRIAKLRKSDGYFDARRKQWYKTAKETGRSYWTKPYIGSVEPILGISLSAPAADRDGKAIGVYGLDLILTSLSDFMKRQRLGKTGRAFLMDGEGYLIASSGGVSPVVADHRGHQQRLAASEAPDLLVRATARHLSRHPEIIARSRLLAIQSFVFKDSALGRVSAAVDCFGTSNGDSWLVVSALPASEFLGDVQKAGLLSLGLMATLIMASLAGGFWAVNRVLRPLEALTTAAHVIAEGGWLEVPETDRNDEIGVLARALDNMTRALRNVHAELEQRVTERTAELREKELLLLQQTRLAALGEMIGNIAHQWRQPLNLLGLSAQELPMTYRQGNFSKEYLDTMVRKMLETIRHMSKTIDDFRNFSTPEKEKVDFRIVEVLHKTISLLDGTLHAHRIEAKVVADADPMIKGYPNELSQALLNIVVNARDALVAKAVTSPTITIVVETTDGSCVVTVADNAGGVPEEIMEKIFDPYFTTKAPDKGTGIGLYMTKIIIEKNMGGRISVRNTAEGAEFRIEMGKE